MSKLSENIDISLNQVSIGSEGDFLLNSDGTVYVNTWFWRLVCWIRNFLLCTTTEKQITALFQTVKKDYEKIRNGRSFGLPGYSFQTFLDQRTRVGFVAHFIHHLYLQNYFNQGFIETNQIETWRSNQPPEDPFIQKTEQDDQQLIPLSSLILKKTVPFPEIPPWIEPQSPDLPLFYQNLLSGEDLEAFKKFYEDLFTDQFVPTQISDSSLSTYLQNLKALFSQINHLIQQHLKADDDALTSYCKGCLQELVANIDACGPGVYESTFQCYEDLSIGTRETVQCFILLKKEQFIESMILNLLPGDDEHKIHPLNYIRKYWGERFGLRKKGAHLDDNEAFVEFTKKELEQTLTDQWGKEFIDFVRPYLNNLPPLKTEFIHAQIRRYLENWLKRAEINNPDGFIDSHYYSEGQLNDQGVIRLVRLVFSGYSPLLESPYLPPAEIESEAE